MTVDLVSSLIVELTVPFVSSLAAVDVRAF